MENFVKKLKAIYAILYTGSGVIISDYFEETMDYEKYHKMISSKINEDIVLIQKLADRNIEFTERMSNFDGTSEFLKKYDIGKNTFYLKMYTPRTENEVIQEKIKEFHMDLEVIFN